MEDLHCWQSKFKYCPYSHNLINKIRLLNKKTNNKVNLTEIKKAIFYCKKYHSGQIRNSGEPYYTHPLIVTEMVADFCFKTNILVTSILHDTLEDTNMTRQHIKLIFGSKVAEHVENLTRIKPNKKITSAKIVELLWFQNKQDLLWVKFFDRVHNMITIKHKSIYKQEKITKETLEQFLTLGTYFQSKINNKSNLEDLITNLCFTNIFSPLQVWDRTLSFDDHFQLDIPNVQNEKYQI